MLEPFTRAGGDEMPLAVRGQGHRRTAPRRGWPTTGMLADGEPMPLAVEFQGGRGAVHRDQLHPLRTLRAHRDGARRTTIDHEHGLAGEDAGHADFGRTSGGRGGSQHQRRRDRMRHASCYCDSHETRCHIPPQSR
ncbi:MAG: hypothetical protein MZW92_28790 [Comamonadaceae bacterium]|nr:hypothetical protein [Comamonadaceae bacterium]